MGNNPSVQVPDRESVSDMGTGVWYTKKIDLNYLKESDHSMYAHMGDGKPDVFTHTLAVNIVSARACDACFVCVFLFVRVYV
jgi:hypothetical protein